MRRIFIFLIGLFFLGVLFAGAQEKHQPAQVECSRLVSLAPSITETLFALGLGKALVGVTRYDHYPQAVDSLPRVGGLLDPSLEAIMLLKPSLVLLLREHADLTEKLRGLGIATLSLKHDSVGEILDSFGVIAKACGVEKAAENLRTSIETSIENIREQSSGIKRRRVLVVVGNGAASEYKNMFISGRDGFFSQLLDIAGGENVYQGSTSSLASLSAEGLLRLNPQIIISVATEVRQRRISREELLAAWSAFPGVAAVRHGHIFALDRDYASIPGPRLVKALADIQHILKQVDKEENERAS